IASERVRVDKESLESHRDSMASDSAQDFAQAVLYHCLKSGDRSELEKLFAPYCVSLLAPNVVSGRNGVLDQWDCWRTGLSDAKFTVDHVCHNSAFDHEQHIAARWSLSGRHSGELIGIAATNNPVFVLGITHWRIVAGKISSEWNVVDRLGVLTQLLRD
ncbi:MAG: ester cyclase, partial [Pseudomonadota bacterium]